MLNKRVVFIGPRVISVTGKKCLGGGTVLFETLVNRARDIDFVINSNGTSRFIALKYMYNIWLMARLLFIPKDYAVVFFVAHRQARQFMLMNMLIKRKITIRYIGANFDFWYRDNFTHYILSRSSTFTKVLCELTGDVEFFRSFGLRAEVQENFREEVKESSPSPINESESVGFLGRICEEKGVSIFLDLARKFPERDFFIAGPIDDRSLEKKLLNFLKSSSNLEYLGALPYEKTSHFWKKINVLFFHSDHKGEGKPGVLVEALMRKVPVITNYKVNCVNWDVFYEAGILNLTKDYENSLKESRVASSWNSIQTQRFSSAHCFNELIAAND